MAAKVPSANLYRAWAILAKKHQTSTITQVYNKALEQAEAGERSFENLFYDYISHLESTSDSNLAEVRGKLEGLGLLRKDRFETNPERSAAMMLGKRTASEAGMTEQDDEASKRQKQ